MVNIVRPKVVVVHVLEIQTPILGALSRLNIGPTVQAARDLIDQLPHLEAFRLVCRKNHAWRAL